MNQIFKNINIEDVLFYDLELVRKNKELDINSKEFELYQKKLRNRDTDELPTSEETTEHYRKFAALKMGYNKIVCATTGKVIEGKLYLRSFTGTEDEVLRGLYSKFQSSKYISGFNILAFDGAMSRVNSLRYEGVAELLPEQYNDSGKKPWELKNIIDLMDVFKGSHWSNPSLDEVCYHLGIESPKEDIDGSQVSETFYEEGVERIEKYCKKDVLAVVNVFRKLQLKEVFSDYIDANDLEVEEKPIGLINRIFNAKSISEADKGELKTIISKKRPTKKEKEILLNIVRASLSDIDPNFGKIKNELTVNNIIDELTKDI